MGLHRIKLLFMLFGLAATGMLMIAPQTSAADHDLLDQELAARLRQLGFTGQIESTLEHRIGHRIDNQLADLGRLLFFDTVGGLNDDNNCSGCHSPTNGFGDTQSIAIGVDNNGVVGLVESRWSAQSTTHTDGCQYGLLSKLDVELTLCFAVEQPVR